MGVGIKPSILMGGIRELYGMFLSQNIEMLISLSFLKG
ncbi:nheIM domain protein [Escherichia coli 1-110-08_S1_C2]|nr:nheIM domain protein [Escherichia coli 1-110-08_S1_C2]